MHFSLLAAAQLSLLGNNSMVTDSLGLLAASLRTLWPGLLVFIATFSRLRIFQVRFELAVHFSIGGIIMRGKQTSDCRAA